MASGFGGTAPKGSTKGGTGEPLVDDDGVVRIGSVVFALIQPTPGHEAAFNRWYERDHYYTAGTAAPGVFSAGRFVESTMGAHLALYFVLPGHDDARVVFATDQVQRAVADGRTFDEREHLHTWNYTVDRVWRAEPDGVPAALALDHRYPALSVWMLDTDGELPVAVSTIAADVVMVLRPLQRIMPATWDGDVDPDRRRLVVAFHRDPPGPDPFVGVVGLVWTGAFVPVVFGTGTPTG